VCSFLEFSVEEYDETKAETLDQLREFQAFLERSLRGDMTLVDEFGHAQLVSNRWGGDERSESGASRGLWLSPPRSADAASPALLCLLVRVRVFRPSKPPCLMRSRLPR